MWPGLAKMRSRHHGAERHLDRPLRVGEETGNTGERLVRFGVEHMENGADQQGMAGLLPMVAPLQRSLGVDQHVSDILDIAHLPLAAANLQQRIVGGRLRVGRIEQQHAAMPARESQTSGSSSRP